MTNVKKSWKTHGKMDLQAVIAPNTAHYVFQWSEGGEIPKELTGSYTSMVFMETSVASYLANSKPKEQVDERVKAKAKDKSQKRFRAGPTMTGMGGMRQSGTLRGKYVK